MEDIPKYDTLGIYAKSLYVRQTLEENEELYYSCDIAKYNRYGFQQDRILLITNKHLYTLDFAEYNYRVHRKALVRMIESFTTSTKATTKELVVHFMGDYDERYEAGEHLENIQNVIKKFMTISTFPFKSFEVPDKKLRKYNTSKKEAAKGKFCRPDEKWLVPDFDLPNFKYSLVTSQYRPTMNIANDFSESRVPTEADGNDENIAYDDSDSADDADE